MHNGLTLWYKADGYAAIFSYDIAVADPVYGNDVFQVRPCHDSFFKKVACVEISLG